MLYSFIDTWRDIGNDTELSMIQAQPAKKPVLLRVRRRMSISEPPLRVKET